MDGTTVSHPGLAHRLRLALQTLPREEVAAHHLMSGLGADTAWLLFLLLGIAALVPSPGVPLGVICGGAIIVLAGRSLAGRHGLPERIASRRLRGDRVAQILTPMIPWVERLEAWASPRLPALTAPATVRLWLALILFQGILIALPIPAGNFFPGLAVALIALGLMRQDGLALLAGLACCVLAAGWLVVLSALGSEIASYIMV